MVELWGPKVTKQSIIGTKRNALSLPKDGRGIINSLHGKERVGRTATGPMVYRNILYKENFQ